MDYFQSDLDIFMTDFSRFTFSNALIVWLKIASKQYFPLIFISEAQSKTIQYEMLSIGHQP